MPSLISIRVLSTIDLKILRSEYKLLDLTCPRQQPVLAHCGSLGVECGDDDYTSHQEDAPSAKKI